MHESTLPDCAARFAHLEGIADSYKDHKKENLEIQAQTIKNTTALENIDKIVNRINGLIVTVVCAIIAVAVTWGSLLNRVDNLEKYAKFIMDHSYGVRDYEQHTRKTITRGAEVSPM